MLWGSAARPAVLPELSAVMPTLQAVQGRLEDDYPERYLPQGPE